MELRAIYAPAAMASAELSRRVEEHDSQVARPKRVAKPLTSAEKVDLRVRARRLTACPTRP